MLNKKYNEQDVRQLFSSQGSIEECTVLRDQNGQSKGCAFVTYATKQSAISAIKVIGTFESYFNAYVSDTHIHLINLVIKVILYNVLPIQIL